MSYGAVRRRTVQCRAASVLFIVIFMDSCKSRFFPAFLQTRQLFALLFHFVFLLAKESDLI